MPGVKGRSGGARKGAGRKPIAETTVSKKRHTIYCTFDELFCVKELLNEMRRNDEAWKEVAKCKGNAELHEKAVQNTIEVEKAVKRTTIEQLVKQAEVAKVAFLKKKEEKEKRESHNG